MKANGAMYLTNFRVVLVNLADRNTNAFKDFDFKSYKVYNEQFEQYDKGNALFKGSITTYNTIFPKDIEFSIVFNNQQTDFVQVWNYYK